MASISLDAQALDQLHGDQRLLLDTIDDLRKHGIGQFIDLPQIIVVGDQSSGKSSVLESIIRVHFPVRYGVCTRFATELLLRTNKTTRIDVKILPATLSTTDTVSFHETHFDKDELPRIIEDAKSKMLRHDSDFSEDVLRVEISGPDIPHLTLVDLPGIYHSGDGREQSDAGADVVDQLVNRYMKKQNTIILAILAAPTQSTMQKINRLVGLHDPSRERTVTIITKPDMLKPGSEEEKTYIRDIKASDTRNDKLSWHVLRNLGQGEDGLTYDDRDRLEREFFQSYPWASLPLRSRGIAMLRRRLSTLLLALTRRNLQGIILEIEVEIQERKARLKELGEPRSGSRELRAYLDRIASQFQILSLNALDGNYSHEFFGDLFPDPSSQTILHNRVPKFRALIRDLNSVFAHVLATKGFAEIIQPRKTFESAADNVNGRSIHGHGDSESELDLDSEYSDSASEGTSDEDSSWQQFALPKHLRPFIAQYKVEEPRRISFEKAANRLGVQSSVNRGNEFPGTSNDRLAVQLFRHQSRPWGKIAREHLRIILGVTRAFVERLLSYVTGPDIATYSSVLSQLIDPFFEKSSTKLEEKLDELLHHYINGHPQPLEAEFKCLLGIGDRKIVETELLQSLLKSQPGLFTEAGRLQLLQKHALLSKSRFDAERLLDKAATYHQIALRTFTENVIILAVENCLIEQIPRILTTEVINELEDEELESLVAESEEIRYERAKTQEECESLRKGLRSCDRYREHTHTYLTELDTQPGVTATMPGPITSRPALSTGPTAGEDEVAQNSSKRFKKSEKAKQPRSMLNSQKIHPIVGFSPSIIISESGSTSSLTSSSQSMDSSQSITELDIKPRQVEAKSFEGTHSTLFQNTPTSKATSSTTATNPTHRFLFDLPLPVAPNKGSLAGPQADEHVRLKDHVDETPAKFRDTRGQSIVSTFGAKTPASTSEPTAENVQPAFPSHKASSDLFTKISSKDFGSSYFNLLPTGLGPLVTPWTERESVFSTAVNAYRHICATDAYKCYSQEELRLFYYRLPLVKGEQD